MPHSYSFTLSIFPNFIGEQVVAITQASTVLAGVHYGWGTRAESLAVENRSRMLKVSYLRIGVYEIPTLTIGRPYILPTCFP